MDAMGTIDDETWMNLVSRAYLLNCRTVNCFVDGKPEPKYDSRH